MPAGIPSTAICPVTHRGAHYILAFKGALVCVAITKKIYWDTMVKGHPFSIYGVEKKHNPFVENSTIQMAEGCSRCAQLIKQNNVEGLLAKKYEVAQIAPSLPLGFPNGMLKEI